MKFIEESLKKMWRVLKESLDYIMKKNAGVICEGVPPINYVTLWKGRMVQQSVATYSQLPEVPYKKSFIGSGELKKDNFRVTYFLNFLRNQSRKFKRNL